jgi:hypothetical protein
MGAYPASGHQYPNDAAHLRYLLDYNTRFFSDHPQTREYRFRFPRAVSEGAR